MTTRCRRFHARPFAVLSAALTCLIFASCAAQPKPAPKEAFNNAALTTTLQRGVSTPSDVEAALGKPNGAGGATFPADAKPRTIWFYEKASVSSAAGGGFAVQQDTLIVFFKDERFDGFLWFSDANRKW